jgi:hypothetical protein
MILHFEALRYKPQGRGFDSQWDHWIFNLPNLSSRTMVLGSTQPLTEMSMRNVPEGEGRTARKADDITAICERTVYKIWKPLRLTILLASTAYYRDSFTLFCTLISKIFCYKKYIIFAVTCDPTPCSLRLWFMMCITFCNNDLIQDEPEVPLSLYINIISHT